MKFTNLITVKGRQKFCRLLCVSALSTCSLFTYAQQQQVHLSGTNLNLKTIFQQIEEQTKLSVDYNSTDIDENLIITEIPQSGTVKQALQSLLQGTGYTATFTNGHILIQKEPSTTRKRSISGVVIDQKGESVIGANVLVQGTTNGTITDIDGKFTLEVPEGSTLVVTFIGYEKNTIKVGNKENYSIVLHEDRQALDEVVVVGYGTARKKDLAGSAVRADLSTLQESPNVSLAESLHGTIPGLNVGATTQAGQSPNMSIRGRTSISGSNSPLIVLDGIIFRGNMVDLNMNDVESIDVLKDASAAAIYGSEASNGVLLITTKQGKNMKKPVIEYSGSYSYQTPTNDDLLPGSREYFLEKKEHRYLEESRMGEDLLQPNPNWDVTKHMQGDLQGYLDGVDTNWWDLLTVKRPHIHNHNLSVRGKSELSGYYFSMGYTDQQNLFVNDTYKRYSIRLNLDTKITKWLKLGVQSFFSLGNYSGASPDMYSVYGMSPLVSPYDEGGSLVKQPYSWFNNPLHCFDIDDSDKRYNLFANFYADIDIPFIKGLNYRINFSQNLIDNKQYNFDEWGTNFTGKGQKSNNNTYNYTVDNIVTYKNTFNKHSINATFVYGVEKRSSEFTNATASKFSNMVLGYNKLDSGQADLQRVSSGAWEESSLYTMFRATYTYNDKYIFTGTVRRDGFSGFGKNNKYATFPSGAFAWRISEEDFIKDKIEWINNLKLRLSYGQNGNRTVGRYQTLAKMGTGAGYLFGDGAAAEQMQWISALSNEDLKWETTNTFNVGLDFSLLKNRLYGTIDYYRSKTKNLLYNVDIPQINGFSNIPSNIGQLSNKGFEMTITGVPIETNDFSWNLTFNFSRNRNKINTIFGIDNDGDGKEDDLVANKIFIGHPYGVCYDYNIIGMWQLADHRAGKIPAGFTYGTYKVEDINGDGKYTAGEDRKILGYTEPAYRFSIQNSFHYKDWELKFMINSVQGGKNYYYGQPASGIPNPDQIATFNTFKFDYWLPENPNARYRQIGAYAGATGSYSFSPYMQRNFVRLQDVTLSYTVPTSFLHKFNINRLKLYVTGKNLLTITKWDGWDPESGTGMALGAYPVMKSYSVGLNVEF